MNDEDNAMRSYFASQSDQASGLKYRVESRDVIRDVIDTLSGVQKDRYGRVLKDEHGNVFIREPLINEKGIYRAKAFLQGNVTKITHLSRYENMDRINAQIKYLVKVWIKNVVQNRRAWEIQNKSIVVSIVENAIVESKNRAFQGFEAEITGKSHHVSEVMDHRSINNPPRQGVFSRLFGRKQEEYA